MIVEDERIVARDLQQTLETMGYDAFAVAASADEALRHASERCPDVVLMDIRIKGSKDGIDTAGLLHSRFDVPVVYLTAHADDATVERAHQSEPYGYVLKPVKSAELRSAIEIALRRHDLEKRLRHQQRWLATTLESIADAVIVVDLNGRVSFVNPAAEQLLDIAAGTAKGRHARDLVVLHHDGKRLTPFDTVLRDEAPLKIAEATVGLGGAHQRVVTDSVAPVIDDGQILGAVMVLQDMTDQKQAQVQLEQSARMASLGTMAAGVAHEINNPLSVVLANSPFVEQQIAELIRTLEQGNFPSAEQLARLKEAADAQAAIESAATRAAHIVSDLKAFARSETEGAPKLDIATVVRSALRSTSREFEDRAVVENLVSSDPRGSQRIGMDSTKFEQVLVNLLINAAHAIEPGHPAENRVCLWLADAEPGSLSVLLQDTGAGMASEVARRAFDPFFTTKPVGLGTGLGLSICHGMVAAAGGRIHLRSVPAVGTTVELVLPVVEKGDADPPEEPEPNVIRGRLLLIDDDELVLSATARSLGEHDLLAVGSALAALERLRAGESYDLILCDMKMPEMSGIQFFEMLLQEFPAQAKTVVFLTGGASGTREGAFLKSSGQPLLEKPFRPAELRAFVHERLMEQRGLKATA